MDESTIWTQMNDFKQRDNQIEYKQDEKKMERKQTKDKELNEQQLHSL